LSVVKISRSLWERLGVRVEFVTLYPLTWPLPLEGGEEKGFFTISSCKC